MKEMKQNKNSIWAFLVYVYISNHSVTKQFHFRFLPTLTLYHLIFFFIILLAVRVQGFFKKFFLSFLTRLIFTNSLRFA